MIEEKTKFDKLTTFLKFNSDIWAFPLIFFAIPFIQNLFYYYDPTAAFLGYDYLYAGVFGGLYLMMANFFSLGFLRFVVKPMYDYRRKIEEHTFYERSQETGGLITYKKECTALANDLKCKNYKSLLVWLAFYLVPFISFLLVACSFHAVKQ